ncbi:MAG TPA: signal peptidase II [Pirellulales bacterium]|jgi:signal peptidase II|nr:signal peptidase II [Pirellulales bacterium]
MKAAPVSHFVLFASIVVAGCGADLATKSWIFDKLGPPGGQTWWICGNFVGLQTSLNPGALFGIGPGQVWLFSGLSIVAAVGILYWLFFAGGARDRWLTIALAAVMAGILGNLYDRLGFGSPDGQQAVRDWILLQYHDWRWPNFNIADSLLVCGAGMIAYGAIMHPADSPQSHACIARQDG